MASQTKPNPVAADQMSDDGFVAKVGSLKPRPRFLYIMVRIKEKNISDVDNEARHSFKSPKLTRELGLGNQ